MKDEEGITALMISIQCNHQNCAKLLYCEAGQHDNDGQTALMYAAKKGNI